MDVKSDEVVVYPTKRDEEGKQIAPEEVPAERVLKIDVPLMSGGKQVGVLGAGEVRMAGTAIEFASGFRNRCQLCQWFDNKLFREIKTQMEASTDKEVRQVLNNLRASICASEHEGVNHRSETRTLDLDVEHALNLMGYCHALTEVYNAPCFVHPLGGCPDYPGPNGEDLSTLFRPASNDADKIGTAGYDSIMLGAAGKR